ncbi:MAG: Tm-1-like ATP-binding domain-containing protein [Humibacter sp.]
MAPTVVLVGALDTKADEYAFVRDRLNTAGVDTVVVDAGVLGSPGFEPDISRENVAAHGGGDLAALVADGDRGAAMAVMATGATRIVAELQESGRIDGALALGGTGGTSLAATAFRGLPVGFPKLIVSTAASGNTEMYVAETDLILMPSIVDIAGLNRISLRILRNAAAAMAGMVGAPPVDESVGKPMVAASMFGVTTPCVTRARERLESLGYEVLVFHMTGAGGRAMESLCNQGFFAGVLDVTTTELADHLVGGVFDAGPDRLTAAGRTGTPQVISVGALDMVNFGPMDTVPERFRHRNLYEHNSSVTLMRTTPDECAELGAEVAAKATAATGPTTVFLPLGGVSAIAVEGGPFYDADADRRLFDAIRSGLADSSVSLVEVETDVNDPAFADTVVDSLHAAITTR